jgi:hypothetical protein
MKAIWVVVVSAMLFTTIGAGAMYWYRDTEVADQFAAGMAYQSSISPPLTTPASVTLTLTSGTFAQAANIAADGSVAVETDVTDTLTIENTDETRDADAPVLMLTNPVTDKEGLHDNLETDSTEISITIGGVEKMLYHDGDYTNGVSLVDLEAGDKATITVTFTVEVAVAGTFQDGQSYTCYMYLYQASANYCDVVSFTVTT